MWNWNLSMWHKNIISLSVLKLMKRKADKQSWIERFSPLMTIAKIRLGESLSRTDNRNFTITCHCLYDLYEHLDTHMLSVMNDDDSYCYWESMASHDKKMSMRQTVRISFVNMWTTGSVLHTEGLILLPLLDGMSLKVLC